VGASALSGIFPLAGFWSKDEIITHAWYSAQNVNVAVILLLGHSLFTAFYMGRQVALTFAGEVRDKDAHPHEDLGSMKWQLYILAVASVLGGLINCLGYIG
jgi:NADH-quinone oxidoreductase subunit L